MANSAFISGGGGNGIAIGDPVTGGASGGLLYVDAVGDLAQDQTNLFYNPSLVTFGIGAGTNPRQKLDFGTAGGNIALGRFQNVAHSYSIGLAENGGDFGSSPAAYMTFIDEGDNNGTSFTWSNSDIGGSTRQAMYLDRLGNLTLLGSIITSTVSAGVVNASGTINATGLITGGSFHSGNFSVDATGNVAANAYGLASGSFNVDAAGNISNTTSTTSSGRIIVPSILADGTYTVAAVGSITITNGCVSGTA